MLINQFRQSYRYRSETMDGKKKIINILYIKSHQQQLTSLNFLQVFFLLINFHAILQLNKNTVNIAKQFAPFLFIENVENGDIELSDDVNDINRKDTEQERNIINSYDDGSEENDKYKTEELNERNIFSVMFKSISGVQNKIFKI